MPSWNARVLLVSFFLAAAAGCSSGPDPKLKAELDGYVSRLKTKEKTLSGKFPCTRMPLDVGQWVEYLSVEATGEPATLRMEVVGKEGSSFWVQQTITTYMGRHVVKYQIVQTGAPDRPRLTIGRVLTQGKDGKPIEVAELDPELKERLVTLMNESVTGDKTITITVRAGTFQNTVMQYSAGTATHQWFNSEVPLWGVVKTERLESQSRTELVDFDLTGARDVFAKS